jgi:hypothetical protein
MSFRCRFSTTPAPGQNSKKKEKNYRSEDVAKQFTHISKLEREIPLALGGIEQISFLQTNAGRYELDKNDLLL